MKATNKILALAFMAVAMVFASCCKDDDNDPVVPTQQEIETKIVGKWKSMSKYGNAMLTNHRNIRTYNPNGIATLSYSALKDGKHYWINKTECQYSITNNVIDFLCSEENIEFITTIQSISDGKKSVSERKIINGDRILVMR